MDGALSSPLLQGLLQQLHAHVASTDQAAPPLAAATPSLPLPAPWLTSNDLLRRMRAAATSLYEDVLTEDERDHAREWGWTPREEAAVGAAAAAVVPARAEASDEAEEAVPASAVTLQRQMRFHRFSLPLASLMDQFHEAATGVSRAVAYHTSLVACMQQAQRTAGQPTSGPGAAGAGTVAAPTFQQLQQQFRTFILTLRQRIDLQRQVSRVEGNFARALHAIQHELQKREQRQQRLRLASLAHPSPDDPPIPPCDLFALAASLAVVRTQLSLVNGNLGEADSTVVLAGEVDFCSDKTSDQRDVATLEDDRPDAGANLPRLSCAMLSCEKHSVNFSSTGFTTCFLHDVVLLKPLLHTDADRQSLLDLRAQVSSLPRGIASLHPQSSLSQLLLYGFCIHGKIETTNREVALDADGIAALYARDMDSYAQQLKYLIEAERLSDAHPELDLWKKVEDAEAMMQAEMSAVAETMAKPGAASMLGRTVFRPNIEGPCLAYKDTRTADAPASLSLVSRQAELAITFVGMEKVYALPTAATPAVKSESQPMDTSAPDGSSAGVPSASPSSLPFSFAYRFVLSHPLLVPLSVARRSFQWPGNGSDVGASSCTLADSSYYHACRGHSLHFLQSDAGRVAPQLVFGDRQEYTLAAVGDAPSNTIAEPAVLLSSFLCRELAQLPQRLHTCRQLFAFQRLYRSAFDPLPAALHPAPPGASSAIAASPPPLPLASPAPPSAPVKLKWTYRQLMGLDGPTDQPQAGVPLPRIPAAAMGVEVDADAPNRLLLRTSHPTTGAAVEVRVSLPEGVRQQAEVSVHCDNGAVPSNAYATTLLRTTASIPILMHYLKLKCST